MQNSETHGEATTSQQILASASMLSERLQAIGNDSSKQLAEQVCPMVTDLQAMLNDETKRLKKEAKFLEMMNTEQEHRLEFLKARIQMEESRE